MNRIFLVVVCSATLGTALAQSSSRSEIRIQAGPMLSKNAHFNLIQAPPAAMTLRPTNFNGGLVEFSYLNNVSPWIGWNLKVGGGYTEYGFYTDIPTNFYGDSLPYSVGNNTTSTSNIAIATGGLHSILKLPHHFEIEIQMGLGAVYIFNKEKSVRSIEWNTRDGKIDIGTNSIKTDNGFQPLIRGGFGIRYDSGAGTYLLLASEYMYTNKRVADGTVTYYARPGSPQTGATASYYKYFDCFRLQFGIGYRF
ncbi:MAG: hypothetical protein KGS48_17880 [Bacteroidetes bacterium]|nr:hypothetical protein [Bacteroidota bacterium]